MSKTKPNARTPEPIKENNDIDKKDKRQITGLAILLVLLMLIQSNGLSALLGGLAGAGFISSILAWVYFKIVKKERTPNQKTKVILVIAIIDAIIILIS